MLFCILSSFFSLRVPAKDFSLDLRVSREKNAAPSFPFLLGKVHTNYSEVPSLNRDAASNCQN